MSETSIGARVRTAREKTGLSREHIAFWVGISTSTITRLENESRVPTGDTMRRIADCIGVTVDELLGQDAS